MTAARPTRLFGDGAVVIDVDDVHEAHGLAAALDGGPWGVEDVIVGYRSVTVVADPAVTDVVGLAGELATVPAARTGAPVPRVVEIPVTLHGPDLDDVARLASLTPSRVVDLLLGTDLEVAFVGFAPGFAYLIGLPPDLASVPRRPTPRPAVPGGSLALGGGFAGIYPQASPGGWHVVGATDKALFDPDTAPFSVLHPGDRVRLRRVDTSTTATATTTAVRRRPLRSDADRRLLVEDAGLLSFVQDRGRIGVAGIGVPRAGASDPYALRIANRLVGNDEGAAGIEVTARGPTLRFSAPAHMAVVGTADVTVDGHGVPGDTVVPVDAAQSVTVGTGFEGLRAYIAVGGGIDIPPVLGSRSTDVLCGLGAGALAAGDVLGLGPPGRPRGRRRPVGGPRSGGPVRVVVGPDRLSRATVERFLSTTWEVDPASDRIGVRLRAGTPLGAPSRASGSQGMVTGAIQLPPDGRPIILLCDHATVGGYPVVATVVSADLGALGQLRPGDVVRFEGVDQAEAARARAVREQAVRGAVVGWYPVRTD